MTGRAISRLVRPPKAVRDGFVMWLSCRLCRCELLEGADHSLADGYGDAGYNTAGEPAVLILATDGLWEFVSDQVGLCVWLKERSRM